MTSNSFIRHINTFQDSISSFQLRFANDIRNAYGCDGEEYDHNLELLNSDGECDLTYTRYYSNRQSDQLDQPDQDDLSDILVKQSNEVGVIWSVVDQKSELYSSGVRYRRTVYSEHLNRGMPLYNYYNADGREIAMFD